MLTDKELDDMLAVLRSGSTQMSRLNIHEARAVFRFAESKGYTIGLPATEQTTEHQAAITRLVAAYEAMSPAQIDRLTAAIAAGSDGAAFDPETFDPAMFS